MATDFPDKNNSFVIKDNDIHEEVVVNSLEKIDVTWNSYLTSAGSSIHYSFICPITQQIMEDPVIIQDGNTFERAAITKWLSKNNTSPIDRTIIVDRRLYRNTNLKILIQEFMKNNQNVVKKDSELDKVLEARKTQKQAGSSSNNNNPFLTITHVTIPGWNTIQRAFSSSSFIQVSPRIVIDN
jgi:hypothetical protein